MTAYPSSSNKSRVKRAGKRQANVLEQIQAACAKDSECMECRGPEGWRHRRGSYPVEFKELVILFKKEHSLSARETAALFNIPSPTTVQAWEKRYDEGGIQGLADQRRRKTNLSKDTQLVSVKLLEEMSQKELQAELRRLRAENASSKKR